MTVVTRFPTTNAAYAGTGLVNPNNAHADDAVYATAAPGKNAALGTKYGTFGFDTAVPAGATITKVQIIYEYKVSVNTSIATARTLARISGVDQANHDDTSEPLSDTIKTIDITADRSWTRANLLDGTLEAILDGLRGNSNTAVTFSFDYIKVEVTYTVGSDLGSFTHTGQTTDLRHNRLFTASQGAFIESGQSNAMVHAYPLTASQGAFTETGQSATITKTWLALDAAQSALMLVGQTALLLVSRYLALAYHAFAITGPATSFVYGQGAADTNHIKFRMGGIGSIY